MAKEQNERALWAVVSKLETQVESLVIAVRDLAHKQSVQSTTPWGILASWAGLIISAGTVIGVLAMNPVKEDISDLRDDFRHHMATDGHPNMIAQVAHLARGQEKLVSRMEQDNERELRDAREMGARDARLADLERRIVALDENLQREMRDLDAVVHEQIKALDEKLQIEMAGADKLVQTSVDNVQRQLDERMSWFDRNNEWILSHEREVGAVNAAQWARIKNIEREVFEEAEQE